VWRLVLWDGALEGADRGDAARLEGLARGLADRPDDAAAGRSLGEALLGGLPPGPEIGLLVLGPFAAASLASLRLGDEPAAAALPIARVPGVLPRARAAGEAAAGSPGAAGPEPAPAVVLGDPEGDLPASAGESLRIAGQLRVTARLGRQATRAALEAARGVELLHVSARAGLGAVGSSLRLADGPVSPADVARLAPAPRRVVLASCAGSAGIDDLGDGSLAHAFLDAGSEYVVATKWTVDDDGAARLIAAFYEAGGARDPIRGLAAAQLRLAGQLRAHTWASFEVFAGRPAMR
jgi:hypothetical protein